MHFSLDFERTLSKTYSSIKAMILFMLLWPLLFLSSPASAQAFSAALCYSSFSETDSERGGEDLELWTYEQAKEFIGGFGFTLEEFFKFVLSNDRPHGLPRDPHKVYKEFEGYPIFLGLTEEVLEEKTEEFIRAVAEMASGEKKKPAKKKSKPSASAGGPSHLADIHRHREPRRRPQRRVYMSYEEARAFAKKEGIQSYNQFLKWRVKRRPDNFPYNPHIKYKPYFVSYAHFFGGEGKVEIWPFKKARAYARRQGFTKLQDFRAWSKAGNRPPGLPSNPDKVYPEFKGWPDFLNTHNKPRGRAAHKAAAKKP